VIIDWQRILPVVVSILIIISVAVVRQFSNTLAPILATMPINIPLALWIIYSAENGDPEKMEQFNRDLLINILPTIVFMVIIWQASRAHWSLLSMIGAGYLGWALSLGTLLVVRRLIGG
jgi:hypothetical protein